MDRVLLTCPTRGRPELLENMLKSFYETRSENTDILICIDDDDLCLEEYHKMLYGKQQYYIQPRQNVAQIHNFLVRENPGYDFYMPINDDITFLTKDWDKKLISAIKERGDGFGIVYGDDMTGNDKFELPTFGMVSANIVNTLGYFYPLELKMMFGDTFLLDIGRAIGKLFYCPNVKIKHSPPGFAEGAFVPGDHRMDKSLFRSEQLAYREYINNKLDKDVEKLFQAIISRSESCSVSVK